MGGGSAEIRALQPLHSCSAAAATLLCCCRVLTTTNFSPAPPSTRLPGGEGQRINGDRESKKLGALQQQRPTAPSFLLRPPQPATCTASSHFERRTWESQEGQGQKAGSKAKLGRGVMLPCYICPGSLIPIHAHYSSAGPQILANGQHRQWLLPPGQGQKSTEQIFGSAPVLVTKGGGLWMLPPSAHRYRHRCTLVAHPFNKQNQHTYKMPFRNVH